MPAFPPIVLELVEDEPINDWTKLRNITGELQQRGIKIALDDAGCGYASFKKWVELSPDFIKVDQYFTKDLSTNSRKQEIVIGISEMFNNTSEIIIEGIESYEDLKVIKELGIDYAQGYFLGKPAPLNELALL